MLGVAGCAEDGPDPAIVAEARSDLGPCLVAFEIARCGSVSVPEDPGRPAGRRIDLRVVVLTARGEPVEPDPVFLLAGGPGMGATGLARYARGVLAGVREHRDIVLVDQRGTGESNPLECALYEDGRRLQPYLDPMFPPDRVRGCAERLAAQADLGQYTTARSADDLDAVREALGYGAINLFGVSYGSRLALVYLRRHSATVRRVVVQGVIPPEEPVLGAGTWGARRALDRATSACDHDPACSAAIPDPRGDLERLLSRLEAEPARVRVWNRRRLRFESLEVRRRGIEERLWFMMYGPNGARRALELAHAAAEGDIEPLLRSALSASRARKRGRSEGLMLSILCAEDAPRLGADTAAAAVFDRPVVRELVRACREWPVSAVAPSFAESVRSDAPVLLLSGALDPVTPPELAVAAARHLPGAVHLVDPDGGHTTTDACTRGVIARFIALPPDEGLGAACMPRWSELDSGVPVALPR